MTNGSKSSAEKNRPHDFLGKFVKEYNISNLIAKKMMTGFKNFFKLLAKDLKNNLEEKKACTY